MKLNQLIAIVNGAKSQAQKGVTEAYKKVQSDTLLTGISRTYRPKDEEGDQLPAESKRVQYNYKRAFDDAANEWCNLWDLIAQQDRANQQASADVVVDGNIIIAKVAVTTLIFLEKQLVDMKTFIEKIPTLDQAERWTWDEMADAYTSEETATTRTKKVPRNHVKYEATKEHPAQVEVFNEDVIVGTWATRKFSGAIPAAKKTALLHRIHRLQDAVKVAREEANLQIVPQYAISGELLDYLIVPLL